MDVNGFVDRRKKDVERQLVILKEVARNPRGMGTIFPSSDALADEMASSISHRVDKDGVFIEIGAGTGPVTKALLKRGVPSNRLVVIEKSPALAKCLERRFPNVKICCCGAEHMRNCLEGSPRVNAIISSLPFRSLPRETSLSIMAEIERTLPSGGIFAQFTYAIVGEMPFIPSDFRKVRSHVVLFNMPPAKVEVYVKRRGKCAIDD
jgi:phospholipid N-methyltransferase